MTRRVLLVSPLMQPRHKSAKGYRLPQISLPILAALTPDRFDVSIIEEEYGGNNSGGSGSAGFFSTARRWENVSKECLP